MDWLYEPWTVTPWQMVIAFGVLLAAWVLFHGRSNKTWSGLEDAQKRLGLPNQSPGLFFLAALLWTALTALLAAGLVWLIWDVASYPMLVENPDGSEGQQEVWNFRFRIAQMVALTTVLGAVIALPITLSRVHLQREANRTADESLFNQKITEAAADLHARRQKTMRGIDRTVDAWEDDIVRRNAAINRLEDLVKERMRAPVEEAAKRDVLSRVSRLLSIYVRELSKDVRPVAEPIDDRSPENLRAWARRLKPRSDLENAVQTLGRLRRHAGDLADSVEIDLKGSNLQGCQLRELDFTKGNFTGAHMQGADLKSARLRGAVLWRIQMQGAVLWDAKMNFARLGSAQMQGADLLRACIEETNLQYTNMQGTNLKQAWMQGADLKRAQLQGANLHEAQMQKASLRGAQMQKADLKEAQMQQADLRRVQMDDSTNLLNASLLGAALRDVDNATTEKLRPFWNDIFADGNVTLPSGERPGHWTNRKLRADAAFREEWQRVMREHFRMDPENPE